MKRVFQIVFVEVTAFAMHKGCIVFNKAHTLMSSLHKNCSIMDPIHAGCFFAFPSLSICSLSGAGNILPLFAGEWTL
jgi:hypothetical protein